jgi:hypothetical protein
MLLVAIEAVLQHADFVEVTATDLEYYSESRIRAFCEPKARLKQTNDFNVWTEVALLQTYNNLCDCMYDIVTPQLRHARIARACACLCEYMLRVGYVNVVCMCVCVCVCVCVCFSKSLTSSFCDACRLTSRMRCAVLALLCVLAVVSAYNNGMGKTPPIGELRLLNLECNVCG